MSNIYPLPGLHLSLPMAALHPLCLSDIVEGSSVAMLPRIEVKECGCQIIASMSRINLCRYHQGYDRGLEYMGALCSQKGTP